MERNNKMNIKRLHCFFEQSGTFKDEFIKLGGIAEDYDVKNDFGQTDHIIDLFAEIEKAYNNESSIFDSIGPDDLIMAFFPCVRFDNQIMLWFRGQNYSTRHWNDVQKMKYCMKLQHELTHFYDVVNMMVITCIERNLKLIIENPYSEEHYLRRYWCIQPSIIDYDRRERGDYFKKPTQYWFFNIEPKNNSITDDGIDNSIKIKNAIMRMSKEQFKSMNAPNLRVARSMIHPDYANRFFREFILDKDD